MFVEVVLHGCLRWHLVFVSAFSPCSNRRAKFHQPRGPLMCTMHVESEGVAQPFGDDACIGQQFH